MTIEQYQVLNPATGAVVEEFASATDEEVREALAEADQGQRDLAGLSVAARADILRSVADLYRSRREELAATLTREMGKPFSQGLGEIDLCVMIYDYYADHGAEFLADEEIATASGGRALIRRSPIGVLLGVMPWNSPYYQVARLFAPNLMNGNAVLIKPALQCPESALAMQQIALDAGCPVGAYRNLFATHQQVADIIIPSDVIQGVSVTGSERAGAAVAEAAGRNLKKVVLELGGSDPYVVLDAPDLDAAVDHVVMSRLTNCGQYCNSAKRVILYDDIYDEFVDRLKGVLDGVALDNPAEPGTFLGPLSSEQAIERIESQVTRAVEQGAEAVVGGGRVSKEGAWFPPTLLSGVTSDMDIYREEVFGPVFVVFRAANDDEAVKIANDTPYGLGASIRSGDVERALQVADRIEAGMVTINGDIGSSPELPFGGIKRSGFGRELGRYGMDEFVNKKVITIS